MLIDHFHSLFRPTLNNLLPLTLGQVVIPQSVLNLFSWFSPSGNPPSTKSQMFHAILACYPYFYLKGKFQEAESEFIKAGKPKEAVLM